MTKWPVGDVTSISPKAFSGSKATTLVVWSIRLTKSGVKNCLVGSKITKVEVPQKCLKAYKKYFSKENCGKNVKVVAHSGVYKGYPDKGYTPVNQYLCSAKTWDL